MNAIENPEIITDDSQDIIAVIDVNEHIAKKLLREAQLNSSDSSEQHRWLTVDQLHIENTYDVDDIALQVVGDTVINGTLYTKHIADEDIYVVSDSNFTVPSVILPGDGTRMVYADSSAGSIHIMLGTVTDKDFERNRRITVKDVSLELGTGAIHNVNIVVPNCGTRIEYYHDGVLTVSTNAGYAINTNGGAVTLRYFVSPIAKMAATWIIESQFIGQRRSSK